jgi:hypothetical protein
MNRINFSFLLVIICCGTLAMLSSCKDDDPEPNAKISFATSNMVVNENQGTIEVEVVLDRPAPADFVMEYSASGTATRKIGTATVNHDYEIIGIFGELEFAKGETSGAILINITNDVIYEETETIILTIEDVDNNRIDIGSRAQTVITINSDDAALSVSFQTTTLTVNESDNGFHEIVVQLDKPAPGPVTIEYDLSAWLAGNALVPGIAIDSLSAFNAGLPGEFYDYYIDGTSGQVDIPSGQSTGVIRINVLSDFSFENDEKIEITLKASPGVTVGAPNKATINIKQEDGRLVVLDWEGNNADMDLFVWFKVGQNWLGPLIAGITPTKTPPEGGIIPKVFLQDLANAGYNSVEFGGSYVYYEGTENPLDFTVHLIDFANGAPEPAEARDIREASYTLANINPWDQESGTDIQVVQTWTYSNGSYGSVSNITVPESGSRMASVPAPSQLNRQTAPRMINNLRLR